MLPDPLHPAVVHLPMALAVLIPALALETGKDEEDRVERVVSEDLIEAHEEAAERRGDRIARLSARCRKRLSQRHGSDQFR
jgi:hypothetical protein